MIAEEEARARILAAIEPLPPRRAFIARTDTLAAGADIRDSRITTTAVDSFAAEEMFARLPLPAFDNSAMDGYAVIASNCKKGARLRVIGEQPAGPDRQLQISNGEAIRIFTGAPMPAGANAVVMQEDVVREGDEIVLNVDVDAGEFVRKRGCDLSEGQKILGKGERIRAVTLALLASQGFGQVAVGGEVNTAIVSTGDELAKIGEALRPGQIYDSNSILLRALIERCGAKVQLAMHCSDDPGSLTSAIKQGVKASVLIITGGVSVGEHDLVKATLKSLGARIDIWRVAIKPGKPFLFGRLEPRGPSPPASAALRRGEQSSPSQGEADAAAPGERAGEGRSCLIFGLPGNPVSVFVTFLQFVRPAILKMMGATNSELEPAKASAKLLVDLSNHGERAHYVRGKFDGKTFSPIGRQESHALFGLSQANALLRLAPGEEVNRVTIVEIQLFDS